MKDQLIELMAEKLRSYSRWSGPTKWPDLPEWRKENWRLFAKDVLEYIYTDEFYDLFYTDLNDKSKD